MYLLLYTLSKDSIQQTFFYATDLIVVMSFLSYSFISLDKNCHFQDLKVIVYIMWFVWHREFYCSLFKALGQANISCYYVLNIRRATRKVLPNKALFHILKYTMLAVEYLKICYEIEWCLSTYKEARYRPSHHTAL